MHASSFSFFIIPLCVLRISNITGRILLTAISVIELGKKERCVLQYAAHRAACIKILIMANDMRVHGNGLNKGPFSSHLAG